MSACTSSTGEPSETPDRSNEEAAQPTPDEAENRPVYAAVGASETAGWGAGNVTTEAWPRVLLDTALPDFRLLNLGLPGATVEDAIARELPRLRSAEPDIVTVWLNANDILQGVTPREYEAGLDRLLAGIERTKPDQVLVANTPPLDSLPAYRACRPDPPEDGPFCFLGNSLPPRQAMRALVDRYNQIIEKVVKRQGATLVDLFSGAFEARREGSDENLVSRDGLHPSTEGHRAIAETFIAEIQLP